VCAFVALDLVSIVLRDWLGRTSPKWRIVVSSRTRNVNSVIHLWSSQRVPCHQRLVSCEQITRATSCSGWTRSCTRSVHRSSTAHSRPSSSCHSSISGIRSPSLSLRYSISLLSYLCWSVISMVRDTQTLHEIMVKLHSGFPVSSDNNWTANWCFELWYFTTNTYNVLCHLVRLWVCQMQFWLNSWSVYTH